MKIVKRFFKVLFAILVVATIICFPIAILLDLVYMVAIATPVYIFTEKMNEWAFVITDKVMNFLFDTPNKLRRIDLW